MMATNNSKREAQLLADFFKQGAETLIYKKGRRLLASDIGGKVLFVKSGYLGAYLAAEPSYNQARAYYTYGPGDIMEFRSLLSNNYRELVYVPLTNTVLYALSADEVWQEVSKSPDLASSLAREVIMQNELLTRRIENLSYRYASDKLIYRILNLAERFGAAKDGQIYVRIPVTHRQLGMYINMARESVSREMEKLVSRHLISYKRQHVTVLDPAGLVDAMHESGRRDWMELFALVDIAKPKTYV